MSLMGAFESQGTPQRTRFVSSEDVEDVDEVDEVTLNTLDFASPDFGQPKTCRNMAADITANILDRVSQISISANTWCGGEVGDTVAEVSFTEDEHSLSSPPTMPCTVVVASPLRRTKRKSIYHSPARIFMSTPRSSNILSGHRSKKRRSVPVLPSSPIVDLTARIQHGPFAPFIDQDVVSTPKARSIENPFGPYVKRPLTSPVPMATTRRARRRRRDRLLSARTLTKPFPFTLPAQPQSPPHSPTRTTPPLACYSPIRTPAPAPATPTL